MTGHEHDGRQRSSTGSGRIGGSRVGSRRLGDGASDLGAPRVRWCRNRRSGRRRRGDVSEAPTAGQLSGGRSTVIEWVTAADAAGLKVTSTSSTTIPGSPARCRAVLESHQCRGAWTNVLPGSLSTGRYPPGCCRTTGCASRASSRRLRSPLRGQAASTPGIRPFTGRPYHSPDDRQASKRFHRRLRQKLGCAARTRRRGLARAPSPSCKPASTASAPTTTSNAPIKASDRVTPLTRWQASPALEVRPPSRSSHPDAPQSSTHRHRQQVRRSSTSTA